MRAPDLFTASERRLAMLLFTLSLIGSVARVGRGLSPDIEAWLDAGSTPALGDSAQAAAGPVAPGAGAMEPAAGSDAGRSAPRAGGSEGDRSVASGPIDPNTADLDALMTLPGIGPALAKRIIEDRAVNGDYRQSADLLRVKGIGPATLGRLRPRLSLP